MRKTMGLLLAIFMVFSACTFAVSAVKPDNPGKPDDAGRPETIPPISMDGTNPAPEGLDLPTEQTDNTPAADNAPGGIGVDGPQDEPYLPCV